MFKLPKWLQDIRSGQSRRPVQASAMDDWTVEYAREKMREDGLEPTEERLGVIAAIRGYHDVSGVIPTGRCMYQTAGGYPVLKELFQSEAPLTRVREYCGFPET